MDDLTDTQQHTLRWLVEKVQFGTLTEPFMVAQLLDDPHSVIAAYAGPLPDLSDATLAVLECNNLVSVDELNTWVRRCSLTEKAYDVVAHDGADAKPDALCEHLDNAIDSQGTT